MLNETFSRFFGNTKLEIIKWSERLLKYLPIYSQWMRNGNHIVKELVETGSFYKF